MTSLHYKAQLDSIQDLRQSSADRYLERRQRRIDAIELADQRRRHLLQYRLDLSTNAAAATERNKYLLLSIARAVEKGQKCVAYVDNPSPAFQNAYSNFNSMAQSLACATAARNEAPPPPTVSTSAHRPLRRLANSTAGESPADVETAQSLRRPRRRRDIPAAPVAPMRVAVVNVSPLHHETVAHKRSMSPVKDRAVNVSSTPPPSSTKATAIRVASRTPVEHEQAGQHTEHSRRHSMDMGTLVSLFAAVEDACDVTCAGLYSKECSEEVRTHILQTTARDTFSPHELAHAARDAVSQYIDDHELVILPTALVDAANDAVHAALPSADEHEQTLTTTAVALWRCVVLHIAQLVHECRLAPRPLVHALASALLPRTLRGQPGSHLNTLCVSLLARGVADAVLASSRHSTTAAGDVSHVDRDALEQLKIDEHLRLSRSQSAARSTPVIHAQLASESTDSPVSTHSLSFDSHRNGGGTSLELSDLSIVSPQRDPVVVVTPLSVPLSELTVQSPAFTTRPSLLHSLYTGDDHSDSDNGSSDDERPVGLDPLPPISLHGSLDSVDSDSDRDFLRRRRQLSTSPHRNSDVALTVPPSNRTYNASTAERNDDDDSDAWGSDF